MRTKRLNVKSTIILMTVAMTSFTAFAKSKTKESSRKKSASEKNPSTLNSAPEELANTKDPGDPLHDQTLSQNDLRVAAALELAEYIRNTTLNKKMKQKPDLTSYWQRLRALTPEPTVAAIMVSLASDLIDTQKTVEALGSDWFYYRAIALNKASKTKEAIKELEKLNLSERYFSHGLYLRAIYHLELGQTDETVAALNAVLMPETQISSRLIPDDFKRLISHTHMALGRIHYSQKNFMKSIAHYRSIEPNDPNFYRALFEQSWALFLAGYPPYALGSLYGVESPFFANRYNPEAPLLDSIVYYWLCQYEKGKAALASFRKAYEYYSNSLQAYTDRLRFTPDQGYQLLDDYLSGVSSSALGIERQLLGNVAEREHIRLLRNNYAEILREIEVLRSLRTLPDGAAKVAEQQLQGFAKSMRSQLGAAFVAALRDQGKEFQNLNDQADFLEIELLFGEKEQLLGQKLQASLNVSTVEDKKFSHWATREQSWAADDLHEYWWDEIGFQTIAVDDQCRE